MWDAATGSRVAECGGGSDAAPRNQADGRKRALGSILSVAFTRDGREVLFISEDSVTTMGANEPCCGLLEFVSVAEARVPL